MLSRSLILSNRLEEMAEALKQRLFFSGGHPFERRFVIVPSLTIKRFLLMRYAEDADLQIAAGMEIYTLSQAIRELFDQPGRRIPSMFELSFEIEAVVGELLKSESTNPILAQLFAYVSEGDGKQGERIGALSEELALLFLRYGRQERAFLETWLNEEGWQQFLWKRIFTPDSIWMPLSQAVESAPAPSFTIHLFHFSTLPKLFLSFFNQCQTNYFLLSPSPLFWGDLCSNKERASLHKMLLRRGAKAQEKASLDDLLKNQNAFFANLAKAGRDLLNQLLDEELAADEIYTDAPDLPVTLLQKIQRDLFLIRNPDDEEKETILPGDLSIQLHTSTSRWREVEALYDALLKTLDRHSNDAEPIFAKDVLVMAPDIHAYLPYIQAVFGSSESRLSFAIHDLPKSVDSVFIHGIQALLTLCARRFDLDSVFLLFSLPALQKKFNLSQADLLLFRRWVDQANIHWGVDADQRNLFLKEESTHGTWEAGFERLLFGLAMLASEEDSSLSVWPLPIVEKNEMEKLGKLIKLIRSLKDDLNPILSKQEKPVHFWLKYLNCLGESYFACAQEEKGLLQEIDEIAHTSQHLAQPVSFQRVIKALQKHLFQTKSSSLSGPHLDVVRFGNLQEGAALPARVICLLGMEEGVFPRMEEKHSLCALSTHPLGKNLPKRVEEDRYLFLQLVLCASDYLLLSSQRLSSQDGKPLQPSTVVQELSTYVKKAYGAEIKIDHPALPSDPRNFLSGESFSVAHYLAAKTLAAKQGQKSFIANFPLFTRTRAETSLIIELSDLRKLAKNPLHFYFEKNLGFTLPWNEEESEFSLSALDRALLQRHALHKPLAPLLHVAEAKGALPFGHFKELAAYQLNQEAEEMSRFVTEQMLTNEEIFEVELSAECIVAEQLRKDAWVVPALAVPLDNGHTATIVGKISGVTPKGLLFHGKKNFGDLIRIWPELLIFTQLSFFPHKPEVSLFFLKDKKRLDFQLSEPLPLLQKYLRYYELCLENPSPLFPDWAEALIRGSEEELEKKIAASKSSSFKDPYREWLFVRDPLPSAAAIYASWSPVLSHLFQEVP